MVLLTLSLLSATSAAGEADGQLAGHLLTARYRPQIDGQPEVRSATERGLRLRAELWELDDRLVVGLDYRERVPMGDDLQTRELRLLYRGEAGYQLVEDRLTLSVGRFRPPVSVFLPVTGAHLDAQISQRVWAMAFGGVRGISTSYTRVPLSQPLPALGAVVRAEGERLWFEGSAAYAGDTLPTGVGEDVVAEEWSAPALSGHLTGRVTESLRLGGRAQLAGQARYVYGPTASDLTVEVDALGFRSLMAYANWRPSSRVRLDYHIQQQEVAAYTAGTDDGSGPVEVVEPNFLDNRLRGALGFKETHWLRGDVRLRVRPEGLEQRYGLQLDLNDLVIAGPTVGLRGYIDNLSYDERDDDDGLRDRSLWSARAGWRRDGLDVQGSISRIERSLSPVSGMSATLQDSGADLSPFVLEAQRVAALRAYYSSDPRTRRASMAAWFGGLDAEYSLRDQEFRVMVQVGLLGAGAW